MTDVVENVAPNYFQPKIERPFLTDITYLRVPIDPTGVTKDTKQTSLRQIRFQTVGLFNLFDDDGMAVVKKKRQVTQAYLRTDITPLFIANTAKDLETDLIFTDVTGCRVAAGIHIKRVHERTADGNDQYHLIISHPSIRDPKQLVKCRKLMIARGDATSSPVDKKELHRRMQEHACRKVLIVPEKISSISGPRQQGGESTDILCTPIIEVHRITGQVTMSIPKNPDPEKQTDYLPVYVSNSWSSVLATGATRVI